MSKEVIFWSLCIIVMVEASRKCDVCNAVISDIKADKGLAYMAELSTYAIQKHIQEHVDRRCSGGYCSSLVKELIDIADQLDDDLDSTPSELCAFVQFC